METITTMKLLIVLISILFSCINNTFGFSTWNEFWTTISGLGVKKKTGPFQIHLNTLLLVKVNEELYKNLQNWEENQ